MIDIKVVNSRDRIEESKDKYNSIYFFNNQKVSCEKRGVDGGILVIIQLTNEFNRMKKVVYRLRKLFEKKDYCITYYLINNGSKYLDDFKICVEAIDIKDKFKRYAYIYDKICDYLDGQFSKCNFCEFKDDSCIANRNGSSPYKNMGCCHSFDIAGPFSPTLVKNVKICNYLVNKQCSTKNISCKLHTCNYLRKLGIKFNSHKMLALECFFTQKQHDVINLNFFRSKEEILNKLLRKNHEPYLIYLMHREYKVNK